MALISRILHRNIYLATVASIQPTYVILKVGGRVGICHISQVSDYRISNINDYFVVGQQYYVYLLFEDEENNKAIFSYKAIRPEQLKWHYYIIPTISDYNNLYRLTMDALSSLSAIE